MKPGQHQLSREYLDAIRREQLIRGGAEAVASKGNMAVKIDDLVAAASCARKTFYEYFDGRGGFLLAVVDFAGQEALQRVAAAAAEAADTFTARLRAGIEALLDFAAENRELSRVFLIDGPAVAPEVLEEVRQRFAGILAAKPGTREDLIVGSIESVLYRHAVEKPDDSPQTLAVFLCDLVLSTGSMPAIAAVHTAPSPELVAA